MQRADDSCDSYTTTCSFALDPVDSHQEYTQQSPTFLSSKQQSQTTIPYLPIQHLEDFPEKLELVVVEKLPHVSDVLEVGWKRKVVRVADFFSDETPQLHGEGDGQLLLETMDGTRDVVVRREDQSSDEGRDVITDTAVVAVVSEEVMLLWTRRWLRLYLCRKNCDAGRS